MNKKAAFQEWWAPLSWPLKAVMLLIGWPAATFLLVCIVSGNGKSLAAAYAFGLVFTTAAIHIIFDKRNRKPTHQHGSFEIDLGADGGGD